VKVLRFPARLKVQFNSVRSGPVRERERERESVCERDRERERVCV